MDTDADPTLGTVTWWEIPVVDLDEAARFYGAVFGWETAPFGEGFLVASCNGRMVGGLFADPAPPVEGVRVYVNVADLEAVLTATEAAGGAAVRARTLISEDMGWWAEIADPSGRRIGLCSDRGPV